MGDWFQDIRVGWRALRRQQLVSVLAVLSLALAIAGNGAVFSLVSALLLRPFPYAAEGVQLLLPASQERSDDLMLASPANFVDWRQRSHTFQRLAAFRPAVLNLTGDGPAEALSAAAVTPDLFPLLQVVPVLGRDFSAAEGQPGAEPVVMLSHALWRERFGADLGVLGRVLELNGERRTVVGVMPEGFWFFSPGVQLWFPLVLDPAALSRGERSLLVVGRLADGGTAAAAQSEMAEVSRQLAAEHPETNAGWSVRLLTPRQQFPGKQNRLLLSLLQGAMGFVLLMACVNVANLLLARGQDRQQEIAVRAALGGSRGRLLRQLVIENLLLAAAGGACGLALGIAAIRWMQAGLGDLLADAFAPRLDAQVMQFTLAVALGAGLLFGLLPALRAARPRLSAALRVGSPLPARRGRLGRVLVVAEVALALITLSGTGLLVYTFLDVQQADMGVEASGLLTFRLNLPGESYPQEAQLAAFWRQLQPHLAALPGVRTAALTSVLPRSPVEPWTSVHRPEQPPPDGTTGPTALALVVSTGYFEALGIPLLTGQPPEDAAVAQPAVWLNAALAARLYGTEPAAGQRLMIGDREHRVAGVVGNVLQTFQVDAGGPPFVLYLTVEQSPPRSLYAVLATGGDPLALAGSARDAVAALDPRLPVTEVRTLEQFIRRYFAGVRVLSALMAAFGVLALVLAAVGVYGVIAYSVARRGREVGLRMALGAHPEAVRNLILREGLQLTGLGFALGLPGVWMVTRSLNGLLATLGHVQPGVAVAVGTVLFAVAIAACYLPARRAAAVDPMVALRDE